MTTREQARQTIELLGVAPIFSECYTTKRLPHNLDIFFSPPEEFFLAADSQERYAKGKLIPLLDDGNFGIVTFYDPDRRVFVQKDVESPEETAAEFTNWQQYLADLMMRIGEAIDDDDELREIAALLQFKHFDVTLAFLDSEEDGISYEAFSERRRKFIASLTG